MFQNISKCLYEMCLKFEIMKCRKSSATMNSREKAAICLLLQSWTKHIYEMWPKSAFPRTSEK